MIKVRQSFNEEKPSLYLISTPIGNLKDITLRALEVFEKVDLIYAEDTRVTLKLLNHYNINKRVESYHSFNEEEKTKEIIYNLENGMSIAFCTDAGTPAISDPGYYLVSQVKNNFPVVSIPGASAVLAAIVASGLIPQPFTFIGFTDKKKTKRFKELESYKSYSHTLVFYERGDRVSSFVNDLYDVFGKRKCVLAKELTKIYETYYEFNLGENIDELNFKGEFVVMVSGKTKTLVTTDVIKEVALTYLKKGHSKKDTINLVTKELELNKNTVYDIVINLNMED